MLSPPPPPIRVVLGIPCYNGILDVELVRSVTAAMDAYNIPGSDLSVSYVTVDNVPDVAIARALLVRKFVDETDGTHLIFVDNDITFPPEAVRLSAVSGLDVTTMACPKKLIKWDALSQAALGGVTADQLARGWYHTSNYEHLPDEEGTRALQLPPGAFLGLLKAHDTEDPFPPGWLPIARAGTGFLTVTRTVLRTMIAKYPSLTREHPRYGRVYELFQQRRVYQTDTAPIMDHIGEDWAFCDRVLALGYKLYVHTDEGLQHTGDLEVPGYRGTPDNPAGWWKIQSGGVKGLEAARIPKEEVEADAQRAEALARYLRERNEVVGEGVAGDSEVRGSRNWVLEQLRKRVKLKVIAEAVMPGNRAWAAEKERRRSGGDGAEAPRGGAGL